MHVIGLISGTSVDGVDAALMQISGMTTDLAVTLLASETMPYPSALREQILAACGGAQLSIETLAQLDDAIATTFAQAALMVQADNSPAALIGSHGQTLFHRPPSSPFTLPSSFRTQSLGYSLQLGRGEVIAAQTGIPTVSNFRVADIAMGGQGAPLVPAVDRYLLAHGEGDRCIQNIGGIGNVAYIPALKPSDSDIAIEKKYYRQSNATPLNPPLPRGETPSPWQGEGWGEVLLGSQPSANLLKGWDTGPGNALIDLAVHHLSQGQLTFDADGTWAATGTVCEPLVNQWMQHPYFHQAPPKSTGRELFGPAYLHQCLQDAQRYDLSDADILATITELTVASIDHSYRTFLPHLPGQVLVCGGGSHNTYLLAQLRSRLSPIPVLTTGDAGVNADFKEAIAFGVLAYWYWHGIPGNLPVVTGAKQAVPLGQLHLPPQLDNIS
ncbi:MAG: anhydro-N-acetylmuramic acid kinase [Cyanothece sp. SIO2G6]|nr:anhydro-N-acetylmuramic acid kinase [Cyanothece sp. SIO2G6]